ncbi:MAG: hypothetical protein M1838_005179 [Thelocarpon superellum]|nr:MAG: hypothetical protein M1838_005179 [Thelocarpon superellum]
MDDGAQIVAKVANPDAGRPHFRSARQVAAMELARHLFPERGLVREDQYDEARDAMRQMTKQVIEAFAPNERESEIWQENWPIN